MYYDSWVNPKYIQYSGKLDNATFTIRFVGTVIIIIPILIYLVATDFEILSKKREINLTPWKSTN
jgi:hypothetical protein